MFSAWTRAVPALELPLDHVELQVEEVQAARLEALREHVGEQRLKRSLGDRPAAEPSDDVVHPGLEPG